MSGERPAVRLRQAVVAAAELEPTVAKLRGRLEFGEPFHDPGVGMFGLSNAVLALGDCFLEVVSPTRPSTAAGRYMERHGGDCGYMVIFDLEDLEGARARTERLGIRVVWSIDLPDISATHLHPADIGGAIVSLDRSNPFGSWRWGGPEWIGKTGSAPPGRLASITMAMPEAPAVAARWAEVLGIPVAAGAEARLELDGAQVHFVEPSDERGEGLIEIGVEVPADAAVPGGDEIEIGSARLRVLVAEPH